jgi:hypothetical protein
LIAMEKSTQSRFSNKLGQIAEAHVMEVTEVIFAYGHENIQATHETTLEITKERRLSKEGTCIIAVSANKALVDLSSRFKEIMRENEAKLTLIIEAGKTTDVLRASGSPRLDLTHLTDMVIRKSDYICSRTLAIRADKAAHDLSKSTVAELKNPRQKVKITLTVKV